MPDINVLNKGGNKGLDIRNPFISPIGSGSDAWDFLSNMLNPPGADISGLLKTMSQGQQQALGLLSPFMQAGAGALSPLSHLLNQGQDPTALVNQISSQFTESPAFKQQLASGQQALQNKSVSQGISGSPIEGERLQQFSQGLTGQAQQQFLQNVLGQRQQEIGGLSGLAQLGLGAAGTGASTIAQISQSIAEAQAAKIKADASAQSGLLGGLGKLGGAAIAAFA